jgi:hypothetical protein
MLCRFVKSLAIGIDLCDPDLAAKSLPIAAKKSATALAWHVVLDGKSDVHEPENCIIQAEHVGSKEHGAASEPARCHSQIEQLRRHLIRNVYFEQTFAPPCASRRYGDDEGEE